MNGIDESASVHEVLSLRPEAILESAEDNTIIVRTPYGSARLDTLPPEVRDSVLQLNGTGATLDELEDGVSGADPSATGLARLYFVLDLLEARQLIWRTVVWKGCRILRVERMAPGEEPQVFERGRLHPYQLSRFAYLRPLDDSLVLESPVSSVRIRLLSTRTLPILGALATPVTLEALCASIASVPPALCAAILERLVRAGVVEQGPPGAASALTWEFHDLLFHARIRTGNHDYPTGGLFRWRNVIPPLPAVKPQDPGPAAIALFHPALDKIAASEQSFTSVLERRISIRAYDTQPITVDELGEFLYRTARVRETIPRDEARGAYYEMSRRPYPSGGATYDTEIYVTVNRCDGLARGIYHYDPLAHQLIPRNDDTALVDALLQVASLSAGGTTVPQILLTLTSRIRRIAWKYSSIAYAVALKNAGVLYQTFYLVATAMGLAPCGLGSGDSRLVARAMKLDPLEEPAVGEFMLGRPAIKP